MGLTAALAERLLQAVDDGFDEQLRVTMDLVRCPSVRGAEASAQDLVARELAARGHAVERWTIDPEELRRAPGFSPVDGVAYGNALSVVGTLRAGAPGGRSLIVNGHVDVVPAGPLAMWTSPPFAPEVRNGWLYGRGAGDMKSGLIAALFALEALRRTRLAPAGDVQIHSVIEEECTGNGALSCVLRGYRADAVLIPEPIGLALLSAQVGVMWFQLRLAGHPVHVAVADTGSNAILAGYRLIAALRELAERWNARRADDPHFRTGPRPINFNVGRIAGGDWASSVPAWCRLECRISLLPGQELAAARAEVEACVAAAARDDPFLAHSPPEVVWNGFQAEPFVPRPGGAAEACLRAAHARVFGTELPQRKLTGTTDARFYGLNGGMPVLVYGALCENAHGFDERVELASLRQVTRTLALFIADWCGVAEA
ncbi:MAG TPA: ArgE/DapE family deacylase [Geminicoccaceae bacterium]|nr:ArgE/DapE family deacylase [Geminicoccaceae bacterium]